MLLDERTGVEAPPEPPPTRTCSNCGGELADVQEWCLECGQRQPNRGRWTARVAALVVSGVVAFAGGGTALAYVALRDDANNQSSKILAEAPQVQPPGETPAPPTGTPGAPATPPPTATTPSPTSTTPAIPGTTTPKPPPLSRVQIHPRTTPTPPTPPSTSAGTTTGSTTTGGSTGASTGTTGSHHSSGTTNTKPKRVKTVPKRPADAGERYAKGFSPTNAVDFDPLGDGHEDAGDVRSAIDRNLKTSWTTDDYPNGLSHGVGLFVDAGSQVDLRAVELATTTPGWGVSIYGNAAYPNGAPPGNGWQLVGQGTVGSAQSAVGLGGQGTSKFEYYLVWITSLPSGGRHATISEVTLLGAQTKTP